MRTHASGIAKGGPKDLLQAQDKTGHTNQAMHCGFEWKCKLLMLDSRGLAAKGLSGNLWWLAGHTTIKETDCPNTYHR